MKFARQQHIELMSFGDFDRPMFSELFGPLIGLPEEWQAQGATQDQIDMIDFDWDYVPYVDCGVNVMHPCEPNAGMDIVELRKHYGNRLAILGGIDKFVLYESKEDIHKELEYKMQPMMQQAGGMVFGLDHRIPNVVPFDNYCYYVDLGREILGFPPLNGKQKGWGRMAF
jgi:hypothetical protein